MITSFDTTSQRSLSSTVYILYWLLISEPWLKRAILLTVWLLNDDQSDIECRQDSFPAPISTIFFISMI